MYKCSKKVLREAYTEEAEPRGRKKSIRKANRDFGDRLEEAEAFFDIDNSTKD